MIRLSREGGRRYVVRLARIEFGDRWVDAVRAFWGAWRALELPEMDEGPADQVLSAICLLLGALRDAEDHVGGHRAPLRGAAVVLGQPPARPAN